MGSIYRHIAGAILIAFLAMLLIACGNNPSLANGSSLKESRTAIALTGPSSGMLGTVLHYSATVTGSSNTSVKWTVNGVPRGDVSVGTLTQDGLYTAPRSMPAEATVILTARSVANPAVSQNTMVTLVAPTETTTSIDSGRRDSRGGDGRDDDRANDAEPGRIGWLRSQIRRHDEPDRNMERKPVDRRRNDLASGGVYAARKGAIAQPGNDPCGEPTDAYGLRIDFGDAAEYRSGDHLSFGRGGKREQHLCVGCARQWLRERGQAGGRGVGDHADASVCE